MLYRRKYFTAKNYWIYSITLDYAADELFHEFTHFMPPLKGLSRSRREPSTTAQVMSSKLAALVSFSSPHVGWQEISSLGSPSMYLRLPVKYDLLLPRSFVAIIGYGIYTRGGIFELKYTGFPGLQMYYTQCTVHVHTAMH